MNSYRISFLFISIIVELIIFILKVYELIIRKYAKEVRKPGQFYALTNKYPCTVGAVTEVNKGTQRDIGIFIEDEVSKEETEIVLVYREMKEEERAKAYYLLYMKIGTAIGYGEKD